MSTKKVSEILNESGCISLHALQGAANRSLSDSDLQIIKEHTSECELCNHAVNSIQETNIEAVGTITANVNREILSQTGQAINLVYILRKYWYFFAAVLLIFLGFSVLNIPENSDEEMLAIVTEQIDSTKLNYEYINELPHEEIGDVSHESNLNINTETTYETQTKGIANKDESENDIAADNTSADKKNGNTGEADESTNNDNQSSSPDLKAATGNSNTSPKDSIINTINGTHSNLIHVSARFTGKQSLEMMNYDGKGKRPKGIPLSEMPEFWGGEKALEDYVTEKIKQCENLQDAQSKTIRVEFTVSWKGMVDNFRPGNSVNDNVDLCVKDAFLNMPYWKSGRKKSDIICYMVITIR